MSWSPSKARSLPWPASTSAFFPDGPTVWRCALTRRIYGIEAAGRLESSHSVWNRGPLFRGILRFANGETDAEDLHSGN